MTARIAVAVVWVAALGAGWAQDPAPPARHPRPTLPVLPAGAAAPSLGFSPDDGSIPESLPLPARTPPGGAIVPELAAAIVPELADAIASLTGAAATVDGAGTLTLEGPASQVAAAESLLAAVRAAAARTWRVDLRVLRAPDSPEALATVELDVVEGGGAAAAQVTARPFVRGWAADVAEDAVAPQPLRGDVMLGLAVDVDCRPHPYRPHEAVFQLRLAWAEAEPDGAPLPTRGGAITPLAVRVAEVATAVRLRAGERCVAGADSAEVPGITFEVTARPLGAPPSAGRFEVFPLAALLDPPGPASPPDLSSTARWGTGVDGDLMLGPGSWDDSLGLPEWPATACVGPWLVADAALADRAAIRAELGARIDPAWRSFPTGTRVVARTADGVGRVLAAATLPGLASAPGWAAVRRERLTLVDYEVEIADRAVGTAPVTRVLRTGYVHAVAGPADGLAITSELVNARDLDRRAETFHGLLEQPTIERLATAVRARPGPLAWMRDGAGRAVTLHVDAPDTAPDPWARLAVPPHRPTPSQLDRGPAVDSGLGGRIPGLGGEAGTGAWVADWDGRELRASLATSTPADTALAQALVDRLDRRPMLAVRVVALDATALAAAGAPRPRGVLDAATLTWFADQQAAGHVREIGAWRVDVSAGSHGLAEHTVSRPVIRDYDLEVAGDPGTRGPDPIVADWTVGTVLAARAWPTVEPGRYLLELALQHAAPAGDPARFPTIAGDVDQPVTLHASVGAGAVLATGETWCAVAGASAGHGGAVGFLVTIEEAAPPASMPPGLGVWPLVEVFPPLADAEAPLLGAPWGPREGRFDLRSRTPWPPSAVGSAGEPLAAIVAGLLPPLSAAQVWSNGRVLVVRGAPADLARVEAWIRAVAARAASRPLRATFRSMTDAEWATARAGAAARGEVDAELACTATDGRWVQVSRVRHRAVVCDYEVEVASQASITDPISGAVRDGRTLAARTMLAADGRSLVVDLAAISVVADDPVRTLDPHTPARRAPPPEIGVGFGPIQAPAVEAARWEGRVALVPGVPVVVPLGRRSDGRHRVLVIESDWPLPPPVPVGWVDGGLARLSAWGAQTADRAVADGAPAREPAARPDPDAFEVAPPGALGWVGRFGVDPAAALGPAFSESARAHVLPWRLRIRTLRGDAVLDEAALGLTPGVWAAVECGREEAVLADRDVEVAWKLAEADPVMRAAWTGLAVSARLVSVDRAGRARLEVRACRSEPGAMSRAETPAGPIELTRAAGTEIEAAGDVAPGQPWRLGAAGAPHATWFELTLEPPVGGPADPGAGREPPAIHFDVEWRAGGAVVAAAGAGAATGGTTRVALRECRTAVTDLDAEVAQEASAGDPTVRALDSGIVIEIQPLCLAPNGVLCRVDARWDEAPDCSPSSETPAGALTLPRQRGRTLSTLLHCPLGAWLDLPWGPGPDGRPVVVRLRATP